MVTAPEKPSVNSALLFLDQQLNGKITAYVKKRREEKVSYDEVAIEIRDIYNLSVTSETVRRFAIRIGAGEHSAHRRFTPEQRDAILSDAKEIGTMAAARKHGVAGWTVSRWKKAAREAS